MKYNIKAPFWPSADQQYAQTVLISEQQVLNTLFGPKGEPISYLVDSPKLEIGYKKHGQ